MSVEELTDTKDLANFVYNENDVEVRIDRIKDYCEKYKLEDKAEFGVAYSNRMSALMSSQFGFDRSHLTKHVENGKVIAFYLYGKKAMQFVD